MQRTRDALVTAPGKKVERVNAINPPGATDPTFSTVTKRNAGLSSVPGGRGALSSARLERRHGLTLDDLRARQAERVTPLTIGANSHRATAGTLHRHDLPTIKTSATKS